MIQFGKTVAALAVGIAAAFSFGAAAQACSHEIRVVSDRSGIVEVTDIQFMNARDEVFTSHPVSGTRTLRQGESFGQNIRSFGPRSTSYIVRVVYKNRGATSSLVTPLSDGKPCGVGARTITLGNSDGKYSNVYDF